MKIPDEVVMLLDDHIMNTQKIGFSPFTATFEEEVDNWDAKLRLTEEVIVLWVDVQK